MSGKRTACGRPGCLRERLGGEVSFQRMRQPKLTLWPNGQFSLSYVYRTDSAPVLENDEWRFIRGVGYRRSASGPPPNLVSAAKSSQTEDGSKVSSRKKYGLKGITRFGTKMVRSGASLLQRKFGKDDLVFLTLTVPVLSRDERGALAREWGDVMRQVIQRLCRLLERAGQPQEVVSVTELQTARLSKYSQAYLHAHLVLPARQRFRRGWVIDVSEFRTWWSSLIERKIGRQLETLPRIETKLVRKSAEGYLGKYMSKGNESMEGIVEDLGEDAVPGQQWNMSAALRKKVKTATVKSFAYGELVQMHVDIMVSTGEQLPGYWRRIEIDLGGRVVTTAWTGAISDSTRILLDLPTVDKEGIISDNRDSRDNAIRWKTEI